MHPTLRVAFLIAVAIAVFVLPTWWACAIAAVALGALWLAVGLGARRLLRQVTKLAPISALIIGGYALFALDPAHDAWWIVSLPFFDLRLNAYAALEGAEMALRILAVVMASHVARAGDPRALAAGLRSLGMPRLAAASIDATLALLDGGGRGRGDGSGGGRGRGGGGGGGGGRGRGDGSGDGDGFWKSLKRMARGDVTPLVRSLHRHIDRVEVHLHDRDPDLPGHAVRDAAVIAGVALTMLGIKLLKLLPGLPFAPGHKGVLLIPLYLVAAQLTRTRAGATLTGLTMGTVAFLLGDGRYGVFEIAKHVAPGILVDLLIVPTRAIAGHSRRRRVFVYGVLGLVAALGRFATITVIALAVQPPAIVYAVLIPGLLVHAIFGALSGLVTAPLLLALDSERQEPP